MKTRFATVRSHHQELQLQHPTSAVELKFQNPRRPIRIVHSVGHLLRGGIEMWLYQMIKAFDADRFEHHVLVRTDKEEPFTRAFQQAGIRVLPCLNYGNPLKYRLNLRRVIETNGPYDVLHVHGSNPNGLLALLFAKNLGIPASIVHSHNDLSPFLKTCGMPYRAYVALTLQGLRRLPDRGFAVSDLAAESMFGKSWQKDARWKLLYCGVDFEPFAKAPDQSLRKSLGIPDRAYVVGHIGRYHEQKNHRFLVKIAEEAVRISPDVHFLLIGDGELRSEIVSEIRHRGLDRHVTLVRDTLSVPALMLSAMDCFVLPSRYEGLPLVTVEAQAAGLPCFISSNITREAVVDETLVTMLNIDDPPERWATSLIQSRGKRIQGCKTHLNQFYESQFSLGRAAQALSNTYESLVFRGHLESHRGSGTELGPLTRRTEL